MNEKTVNTLKNIALVVAFAALTLDVFPEVKKLMAKNNEDKLVPQAIQDLELENQFQKSPYLYQRYEGYIDRYIKDAKNLTPAKSKQLAQTVAKLDKAYFDSLCEGSNSAKAQFAYDTTIRNGERHLAHNDESYVLCEAESGYTEEFRFKREHCAPDRRFCRAQNFGQDIMCGCHGDHEPDALTPIFESGKEAYLKKANNKTVAMIQSMLYVNGR